MSQTNQVNTAGASRVPGSLRRSVKTAQDMALFAHLAVIKGLWGAYWGVSRRDETVALVRRANRIVRRGMRLGGRSPLQG